MKISGTISDELRLEGSDIPIGGTKRYIDCPGCRHKDTGTQLSRTDKGLIYTCYHANCDIKTIFIPDKGNARRLTESNSADSTEVIQDFLSKDLISVPSPKRFLLRRKFGITHKDFAHISILYNPERESIVFPIIGEQGQYKGSADRTLGDYIKPKSLVFPITGNKMSYFYRETSKTTSNIILVEDPISAWKSSRFMDALCLYGVDVPEEEAVHLANTYDEIFIALDDDTWKSGQPYKVKRSLESAGLCTVSLVKLKKDIKDLKNSETFSLLSSLSRKKET